MHIYVISALESLRSRVLIPHKTQTSSRVFTLVDNTGLPTITFTSTTVRVVFTLTCTANQVPPLFTCLRVILNLCSEVIPNLGVLPNLDYSDVLWGLFNVHKKIICSLAIRVRVRVRVYKISTINERTNCKTIDNFLYTM